MSEVFEKCSSCSTNYFSVISTFYENDSKSLNFLRAHGILPPPAKCPQCHNSCAFKEDEQVWHCSHIQPAPKSKKRRCEYIVTASSDYEGTFLQKTQVQPWKLLLYVNHWLSKLWDPETLNDCIPEFPKETADDLDLSCGQVMVNWFESFKPIGGPNVKVEIDENHILRTKDKKKKVAGEFWVFGGIERISKSKFLVPLLEPVGNKQDKQAKLAIIKKYILPGSVIISDAQNAYLKLGDHGYKHRIIDHSQEFVNSKDPKIHIQNIVRLWRDLRDRLKHVTIRPGYLKQHLARYLFLQYFEDKQLHLHHFFVEAAKLCPPISDQLQVPQVISSAEEDNRSSDSQAKVAACPEALSSSSPERSPT